MDTRDLEILRQKTEKWSAKSGPRVGDFVRTLDGKMRRFCICWDDGFQITSGNGFYFGDGFMSFSGSCGRLIENEKLRLSTDVDFGACWFFSRDCPIGGTTSDGTVQADIECRIYDEIADKGA